MKKFEQLFLRNLFANKNHTSARGGGAVRY